VSRLRSGLLLSLALAIGVSTSLIARDMLPNDEYRFMIRRFALYAIAPVTLFLCVWSSRSGVARRTFAVRSARLAWVVLGVGGVAGLIGVSGLVEGSRDMLGYLCFSGFCASIVVGQHLVRDLLGASSS
jgi:hypothetical protein